MRKHLLSVGLVIIVIALGYLLYSKYQPRQEDAFKHGFSDVVETPFFVYFCNGNNPEATWKLFLDDELKGKIMSEDTSQSGIAGSNCTSLEKTSPIHGHQLRIERESMGQTTSSDSIQVNVKDTPYIYIFPSMEINVYSEAQQFID